MILYTSKSEINNTIKTIEVQIEPNRLVAYFYDKKLKHRFKILKVTDIREYMPIFTINGSASHDKSIMRLCIDSFVSNIINSMEQLKWIESNYNIQNIIIDKFLTELSKRR